MRYTFTTAEGAEKTVNISEKVLAQGKREGLNVRETIERFLSDEGYIVNPMVTELTTKAKANGVNNAGKTTSGKRKPPTRKPDEVKRALIRELNEFLSSLGNSDGELNMLHDVEVTNIERMIAFAIGDDRFELTLSKKRKPKT
jgi:hypothetical protein